MTHDMPRTAIHSAMFLAILAIATFGQDASNPPKLPFTLGKETTVITSPLREDGAPDYLKALNDRFRKDLRPENNGYALLIQVEGIRDILPQYKEEMLKHLGLEEPSNDDLPMHWVHFTQFLRDRRKITTENDTGRFDRELNGLDTRFSQMILQPWEEKDFPEAVKYLETREASLKLIAEAVAKDHWWFPCSGPQNGESLGEGVWTHYGCIDMARGLCARATLRLKSGNFDGFLADELAAKKLARHLAKSVMWNLHDPVVIDRTASESIAAIAAAGTLTTEQCQALARELDALGPLAQGSDRTDIGLRWARLNEVALFSMGKFEFTDSNISAIGTVTKAIDREAVDWNLVMKQINQFYDDRIRTTSTGPMRDFLAACDREDRLLASWKKERKHHGTLKRDDGESVQDYSQRVARAILGLRSQDEFELSWQANCREATLRHVMARAAVAACQYRQGHGRWPRELGDLVPVFLKEMPADIYSKNGAEPVRYAVTDAGIILYSVGPNSIDDHGVRDSSKKRDDIAVGVPVAAPDD